jgi:hypothetical protein
VHDRLLTQGSSHIDVASLLLYYQVLASLFGFLRSSEFSDLDDLRVVTESLNVLELEVGKGREDR